MRKTLIMAAVAGVILFASCQNAGSGNTAATDSTAAPVETKQERNKKVVMASNDAMMKKDLDGMFADAAEGFTEYYDGSMPATSNRDSIKQMINMWINSFSDYKAEDMQYFADGDNVLVYGVYSGTWTGDMMGQKGNGKSFKTSDMDIFTLNEEGKITSHRNVQNWGAVMALQLGVKMQ